MKLLGDVAYVIDCEHRTAPRTDGTPFGYSVGTGAVRNGRITIDSAKPVSEETFLSWTRRATPTAGDLILSREAPMGEVGAVPLDVPVCLGQRTVLLRLEAGGVDQRFLLYALMAPQSQGWIRQNSAGSTVQHLNVADVRKIPMPFLPPIDDQQHIVSVLEDHLSRLDAADANLALAMRRSDAMVTSSLDRLTAVDDSWNSSTVGDEASLVEYGSSAKTQPLTNGNDVPVMRMGNIQSGVLDWSSLKYLPANHIEFPKLLLKPGDLLFNRTNSAELVGKSAVFDGARESSFASYLIRARFNATVNPRWAAMVINSPAGRRYIGSVVSQQVGQANVNGTKLKAFPLPLPPLCEQESRIDDFESVVVSRDRLCAEVERSRLNSSALRRLILAAAFSGRLE